MDPAVPSVFGIRPGGEGGACTALEVTAMRAKVYFGFLLAAGLLVGAPGVGRGADESDAPVVSALRAAGGSCRPLGDGFYVGSRRCQALGREESFALHTPADRRAGSPVILLLHGAGRDHMTLLNDPTTRSAIAASPAVIVLPRGGDSWWVGRSQTAALELLDALEEPLRLTRSSRRRAVAGWSMGGFGSLNLIEDHPDRFAAWGGLVALTDFPNPAYPRERNHVVPPALNVPEAAARFNPMARAERLRGKSIWFSTGDSAFDRSMNEAFHDRLTRLEIAHEFRVVSGGHKFSVVAAELGPMLRALERTLLQEP